MFIIIMILGTVAIGILRLIFGIGNYFYNRANLYAAKLRILKAENKQIFNKWWD